jgi:hypothetical protein
MQSATYNESVFVNCPFDEPYLPLFRAIIYAVYRCGFFPKSALAEENALENRIDKIARIIESCRYGIHDISRVELNAHNLPRFNMPFELGVFYGARRFGDKIQKTKNALVFERTRFSYQKYLSDINGVDIIAHNNDPDIVIRKIRDWLKTASRRVTLPGPATLSEDYKEFSANLPKIAGNLGFDIKDIPFNDYCAIVEEVIRVKLGKH